MNVSLVLLTYNRREFTEQSVSHNLANAGYPIKEIIWVDNGSIDGVREAMAGFHPDITVLHKENKGVAKGYNAGYKHAAGAFVARPGTDMLMPDNWLKHMVEAMAMDEKTGIVAMYHGDIDRLAERRLGDPEPGGRIPAIALGSQLFKTNILREIGYLPESFLLYGYDDTVWERRIREAGYRNYYLTDHKPVHLGDRDVIVYPEYRKFKDDQVELNRQRIKQGVRE